MKEEIKQIIIDEINNYKDELSENDYITLLNNPNISDFLEEELEELDNDTEEDINYEWINDNEEIIEDNQKYDIDIKKILFNDIKKYPILSKDEQLELMSKYKNGDKTVKEILINSNLKLVASIAHKYKNDSIPFLDLFQQGYFGLVRAIEKFDRSKNVKLSTYATYWIKREISIYIDNNSRVIRIPRVKAILSKKMDRIREKFFVLNGRFPTVYELAQLLQLEPNYVEQILSIKTTLSLDKPTNVEETNDETSLLDIIPIKVNIEEEVTDKTIYDVVNEMLNSLSERERKIIELRFGFVDGKQHILEEVGQKFNVSAERIRQIEGRALKKLYKQNKDNKESLINYIH